MDGAVGGVRAPCTVSDHAVSLIFAADEGKGSDNLSVVDKNIAVAVGNVVVQRGAVRVVAVPLGGISVCLHVALGGGEDVHDGVNIVCCGFANFHGNSLRLVLLEPGRDLV